MKMANEKVEDEKYSCLKNLKILLSKLVVENLKIPGKLNCIMCSFSISDQDCIGQLKCIYSKTNMFGCSLHPLKRSIKLSHTAIRAGVSVRQNLSKCQSPANKKKNMCNGDISLSIC